MITLSRYLGKAVTVTSLSGILLFVFLLITGNAMRDILGLLAAVNFLLLILMNRRLNRQAELTVVNNIEVVNP